MKRLLNNIISVLYSGLKFFLIKILKGTSFNFYPIQRFSPNTDIYFLGKGKITLGKKVSAHTGVRLKVIHGGEIYIDDFTAINYGCMFFSMKEIKIGKGVEFGPNVLVYDHDHDFRSPNGLKDKKYKKESVRIGDNCWIGANTVILRGTTIGNNCVVAAGSVLKGQYPDNSIIVQKREDSIISLN